MYDASAFAPSNIALIKYWGKASSEDNIPAVSSLSMTLSVIGTTTRVQFSEDFSRDVFTLNGIQNVDGLGRVSACLDEFRALADINSRANVMSDNNFPTGAGLASSAAGFAALALAADAAFSLNLPAAELSCIARRASGSAARSLFGGWVELPTGQRDTPAKPLFNVDYFPLNVLIAVVSRAVKPISSTISMMHAAKTSDYYEAWLSTHPKDMEQAKKALNDKDFAALGAVAEASCLKMHATIMASRPGLIYWLPATLDCIQQVRYMREEEALPVFFTIDAGPQVKVFCLPEVANTVAAELAIVPGVLDVIQVSCGSGAKVIKES